uniref:Uncharacterized protein n=1 Tax=Panagrolaimus sp. ES5 TaxID=591445 RepID=A0AC34F8K8_9BILA
MIQAEDNFTFETPNGYMTKLVQAIESKNVLKMVVFIELHLPTKYFYQSSTERSKEQDKDLNEDAENLIHNTVEHDLKQESVKGRDLTFECLDGTVSAQRNVLIASSVTMKNQLSSSSNQNVGTIPYTVAVLKPIISFFHLLCFELPDTYSLEYAKEVINAIEYFAPVKTDKLKQKLLKSICQQFAKERNMENPLYRETFNNNQFEIDDVFSNIDDAFGDSLLTNIILQ